jgi:hypothetical protein
MPGGEHESGLEITGLRDRIATRATLQEALDELASPKEGGEAA